jgi:hypothetical protein
LKYVRPLSTVFLFPADFADHRRFLYFFSKEIFEILEIYEIIIKNYYL